MTGSKARESKIERRIRDSAIAEGWIVYKFTGENGVPDRLFLRNGRAVFLEVKRSGAKPRHLQDYQIKRIREAGHTAECVENEKEAIEILRSS